MEFEFTTELNATFLDLPVTAHIKYRVDQKRDENRYGITVTHDEVIVVHAEYECFAEGKFWQRLEYLSQEAAEQHFYGLGEAA